MRKVWAVIPARGGSKRLPRKNIMPLAGSSLIRRTVTTALASQCFARVVVSTDDAEIAEEALSAGADVPFLRPASLADDHASSLDVLLHAVEFLQHETDEEPADSVCLLQATSPFLKVTHIQEAINRFFSPGLISLSTMKEVTELPEWMFCADYTSGKALPESVTGISLPRSAIKKRLIENGALYLTQIAYLQRHRSMYDFLRHGYLQMSETESVDIDTLDDWNYAEYLLSR